MTGIFDRAWPDSGGTHDNDAIPAAFAAAVSAGPSHIAVRTPTTTATYAELDALSQSVATSLGTCPPSPRPVLILADHGVEAVAAALGAIRSGRPALALDPLDPPRVLANAIAHFGGGPLIADTTHAELATELAAQRPDGFDVVVMGSATVPRHTTLPVVDPLSPATVSATSGTTAAPKAVIHSHRNVVANAARYRAAIGADARDVFVAVGPLTAQSTATPVFAALLGSATLCMYDLRRLGPGDLPAFINNTGATVVHLPPAAIAALPDTTMPAVRLVSLGGDRVTVSQLDRARALMPGATMLHRYSTSETNWIAGWSLQPHQPVPPHHPPAGLPVPWLTVRVVGPDGSAADVGETGEIEVSGTHLALGYLDDPDRTAARFTIADDARTFRTGDRGRLLDDGALELVGRADDVHNVRGTLVDLAMVEATLEQHASVERAIVVIDDRRRLTGFVTGPVTNTRLLRQAVAQWLPGAAVPWRIVVLDTLPLTERGKVDRAAMVTLASDRPAPSTEAPQGDIERHVAAVFSSALGIDGIGRHDDLFDLGADSLVTVEVLAAITDRFGRNVVPSVLLECPTPAALATWLTDTADADHGPNIGRARQTHDMGGRGRVGPRSAVRLTSGPSDRLAVAMFSGGGGGHLSGPAMLAHQLDNRSAYAIVPWGFEHRARPDRTRAAMATRAATALAELGHDRIVLVGHSSGGSVAIETARQLRKLGTPVPLVVLLDTLATTSDVTARRRIDRWLRWSVANARQQRRASGKPVSLVADIEVIARFVYHRLRQRWLASTAGIIVRPGQRQHAPFEALTRRALRAQPEQTYDGDVLLVRASDGPWSHLPDDLRWSKLVRGSLAVTQVAGTHNRMLAEPQVTATAKVVEAALRQLD